MATHKTKQHTERVFHSFEEIEREYFPESVRERNAQQLADDDIGFTAIFLEKLRRKIGSKASPPPVRIPRAGPRKAH